MTEDLKREQWADTGFNSHSGILSCQMTKILSLRFTLIASLYIQLPKFYSHGLLSLERKEYLKHLLMRLEKDSITISLHVGIRIQSLEGFAGLSSILLTKMTCRFNKHKKIRFLYSNSPCRFGRGRVTSRG